MNFHVDVTLHTSSEKEILSLLREITHLIKNQGVTIMSTLQELKDAVASVKADIVSEKAEVQALLAALKKQIQDLKDQITAGGLVSQADLDALVASVAEIDTGVKDISEPVAVPTTP